MLFWREYAQMQHFFADVGGISLEMRGKNSYQKYFKGKMGTNACIFKDPSFSSIGGRGLD